MMLWRGILVGLALGALSAGDAFALPPTRLPDFSSARGMGNVLNEDWRAISRAYERAGEAAAAEQGQGQQLVDAGGRMTRLPAPVRAAVVGAVVYATDVSVARAQDLAAAAPTTA